MLILEETFDFVSVILFARFIFVGVTLEPHFRGITSWSEVQVAPSGRYEKLADIFKSYFDIYLKTAILHSDCYVLDSKVLKGQSACESV